MSSNTAWCPECGNPRKDLKQLPKKQQQMSANPDYYTPQSSHLGRGDKTLMILYVIFIPPLALLIGLFLLNNNDTRSAAFRTILYSLLSGLIWTGAVYANRTFDSAATSMKLAVSNAQSSYSEKKDSTMPQTSTKDMWEYKIESPDDYLFKSSMNLQGVQGWELVSARRARGSDGKMCYECILKRKK